MMRVYRERREVPAEAARAERTAASSWNLRQQNATSDWSQDQSINWPTTERWVKPIEG